MNLPLYQSHKKVRAGKIVDILTVGPPTHFAHATCKGSYQLGSACGHCERCKWEREGRGEDTAGARLTLDVGSARVNVLVTRAWMAKHSPEKGGYYVEYDDGYSSFIAASAFEREYASL